jgi:hypothetical protein
MKQKSFLRSSQQFSWSKNSPLLFESEGSIRCLKVPATGQLLIDVMCYIHNIPVSQDDSLLPLLHNGSFITCTFYSFGGKARRKETIKKI